MWQRLTQSDVKSPVIMRSNGLATWTWSLLGSDVEWRLLSVVAMRAVRMDTGGRSSTSANRSHHSVRELAKIVREVIAPAQGLIAAFLFRGFGGPAAKSPALFEVSVHPLYIDKREEKAMMFPSSAIEG